MANASYEVKMIRQVLRAYSQNKLLSDVARMNRLGWKPMGTAYKEGLFWYQAVAKGLRQS